MGAALDYFAVVDHQNYVGQADGGKPVGYYKGSPAFEYMCDGLLYKLFGFGVYAGGGFVQDEYRRVGQNGAGKGYELFFSRGKAVAPLSHIGIIPIFQL